MENCIEYNSSSSGTTALVCTKCKNGQFLNNNTCQVGTKTNCLTFVSNSDTCEVC